MGGWGGGPTTAPYSASKAAVNSLMEAYYRALKPYGFGATSLCPSNINSEIWATELHRPEKFKSSGYNTTPEVIELLKDHCATGQDPVDLGYCLKKGIEDGVVYCFPQPNYYEMLTRMFETKRNYASAEGMVKELALEQYQAEVTAENKRKGTYVASRNPVLYARSDEVGFAKARSDIEWVADVKKHR